MNNHNYNQVFPSELELSSPILLACPQPSCNSSFHNSSHLRLHLVKHHKIQSDLHQSEKLERRFYCPRSTCKYHSTSSASLHFRTMQLLRQHFHKVHAEKHLACPNCSARFASTALLSTHAMRCGGSFRCATCDWAYGSHEALTTHCRRKKHQMPAGSKSVAIQNTIEVQSKTTQTIQTSETATNNNNTEIVFLDLWQKRAETQSTLVQTQCSQPVHMMGSPKIAADTESNGFSTNSCSVQTDFNLNGFNFANSSFVNLYEDNLCHIETQTDVASLDPVAATGSSSASDNHRLSPMIYADIHTQTQCDEFLFGWTHIETQTCWSPAPDDFGDFLNCSETQTQQPDDLSTTAESGMQTTMDGFSS